LPKKTLSDIVDSGNDYIVEVKGNQKNLHKQVKKEIESSTPIDSHITEEKNRGRLEKREAYLYSAPSNIDPEWVEVNRVIKMIRSGIRENKPYHETHYLISSWKTNDAELVSKAIRAHWGIENKLHYVKDVNMNEDKSGIKGGSSAENLSILKNMAINIYRYNGMNSIKYATRKYTNRIKQQMQLIRNTHILKK